MNELPEEKYRRLQGDIQRGILQGCPNPERRGCPGDAAVRNLATNPDSITNEDETDEQGAWYHKDFSNPITDPSFTELTLTPGKNPE